MLSLRNRFGIPGVISVIALVFAMLGGAYAASSNGGGKASASAKAKKGPRGPKGATGPAGPAGPQGPAGANGKDGAAGANGTAGAPGTSVTNESVPAGNPAKCEERGGTEFKVGAGAPTYACNGEEGPQGPEGEPWTDGGTLPAGATETGTWALSELAKEAKFFGLRIPISFPIPLAAPLPQSAIHIFEKGEGIPTGCTGTVQGEYVVELGAAPGNLCIYLSYSNNLKPESNLLKAEQLVPINAETVRFEEAGRSGTVLTAIEAEEGAYANGTWAVTGS